MLNIYEQVDRNKRKSAILMALFTTFIALVAYSIGYLTGDGPIYLVPALVFSFLGNFFGYFFSDKMALSMAKAYPADPKEFPDLHSIVENLSWVAQIPKPKIYLIPDDGLNAFATGRDPQHAAVAITEGLYEMLDRTELEGVLAHEISHIRNYDTRLMMLVAILIGSLSLLIDWGFRWRLWSRGEEEDPTNPIIFAFGVVLILLAPLVANLIKLAISRLREFYADASGAKLTRQPSGLINALKKIANHSSLSRVSTATAHLYIADPLPRSSFFSKFIAKMFSTHPPIEERIAALQGLKI